MVLPGPARLSVKALTWVLTVEEIGEPHRVLTPTAVWRPSDEVNAASVAAREEITALGWYDRRKRLEVEVGATLAVLCRADTEYYGWINRGDATIGVLAAAIGGQALLAVRDGDTVWLKPAGRSWLAEALVGQTADVPVGQGKPVTVAGADVRGSVRGQRLTEAAVQVSPSGMAVLRAQRIAALPVIGGGELYAAMRDGVGRHRISRPLWYADTQNAATSPIRRSPVGGIRCWSPRPAERIWLPG